MNRSRPMALLALVALVGLGLGACGGTTSGGGGGGVSDEGATVTISGSSFGDDITIPVGTTVTFTNQDSTAHTVTEGTNGQAADNTRFDEQVAGGASVTVPFEEAGTYNVTCKIHPSMSLVVTVQ